MLAGQELVRGPLPVGPLSQRIGRRLARIVVHIPHRDRVDVRERVIDLPDEIVLSDRFGQDMGVDARRAGLLAVGQGIERQVRL